MDTTSGDGGPGPVEPGDGATPEGSAPPGGGTELIPSARPPMSIDDVADFETFPPVPDEMRTPHCRPNTTAATTCRSTSAGPTSSCS